MVVQTPPTGGRYSVVQLTDVFTDVAGYVGDGARARTGDTALVVPPGWTGIRRWDARHQARVAVAVAARPHAGRRPRRHGRRRRAAPALLGDPAGRLRGGRRNAPLVLPDFPKRTPVSAPQGVAFLDERRRSGRGPRACARRLRGGRLARAGIGPGRTPSTATGLRGRALRAAAAAGPRALTAYTTAARHAKGMLAGGWTVTPRDTARFGTDYLTRALVAQIGLGANTAQKALYPTADRDSRGRLLSGAHDYVVRFAPGRLPPVRAFWSLTLYDARVLFHDNPLQRFAIGDRTPGLRRDADGG